MAEILVDGNQNLAYSEEYLSAKDNKLNNENLACSVEYQFSKQLKLKIEYPDQRLKSKILNPDHSSGSRNNENLTAKENMLVAEDKKLKNENPDHSSGSKNNENPIAEDNKLKKENPNHNLEPRNINPHHDSVPRYQKQDQSSESRNEDLLKIRGSEGLMPLSVAALYGNGDMVKYLYEKSNEMGGPEWNTAHKQWVLLKCVDIGLFDIALQIIEKHGQLSQSEHILRILALKPIAFHEKPRSMFRKSDAKESEAMQLLKKVWTNIAERPRDEVDKILKGPGTLMDGKLKYNSPILFVATKVGNTEFVAALICEYPDLIWKKNDNNQSIFHIAVSHRQENIYTMLHEIGSMKDLITRLRDMDGNNMIHLVGEGKNQSDDMVVAAFQMQRELLWLKEVASVVPPHYIKERNKDGLTPYELFTKTHKRLLSEGEKWMKETASQCMVVATLIATVAFAAAFTLPGGYHQDSGFPVFREKGTFIVFVVLDAASLISSSTSILLFLSIFTSRCAQQDFLRSFPRKLLAGLAMLFFSIMTMLVAFGISFFVLYQERFIGVAISTSILAAIPVVAFTKLYGHFLMDAFTSQRSGAHIFKPKKQLFHYENPSSNFMIPPYYREEKNKVGLTPYESFTKNHGPLVSKGEKWMKSTANQCMVVATLITTVVFAVAFTIPGGYNQNNGLPVFLRKGPFIAFVVLDAISLILSSTSILVFLSILTSRYAQKDFLESLPRKLLIGLTTLFLSIMTMMIAFSVSFFVLYHDQLIVIAYLLLYPSLHSLYYIIVF
ncbi:hypothetical protein OSB04_013849 [Centaurea solstitialis]|uniref:PGG domain-containing protein n=1 Tax=Centaurea solstitialis TaxID=347529 RepID=A0AA38WNR6_9ASTR|nr:hypothetical protein OSB04_013849 [Centaurea solstitialis]